ncbi:hypothetical protein, partial [Methylobacterium sp. GC_Met_2]|uniref:hypothetical protein n=1 Tax=Methylobacterium sp. GC_Met_2 TaxID=2937376 RepID=UPI00226BA2D5
TLAFEADIAATDAKVFGHGSCDAFWPKGWRQAVSSGSREGHARLRQLPHETFSLEANWRRAATFVRTTFILVLMSNR